MTTARLPGGWPLAGLAVTLVLVVVLARLPGQFALLGPALPVVRFWLDPDQQQRLQLGGVPYDLLRLADAVVPREAAILLVTEGRDVRRTEYITYHRALYLLTPRPVWWLAPAPSDGTWESRWWISASLMPESIRAVAALRRATYVVAVGGFEPLAIGSTVARLEQGHVLKLDAARDTGAHVPRTSAPPPSAAGGGAAWPGWMLAALVSVLLSGAGVVGIVARAGLRLRLVEGLALAWALGAGLISVGMLWLGAAGLSLHWQLAILTALGLGGVATHGRRFLTALVGQGPAPRRGAGLERVAGILALGILIAHVAFVVTLAMGRPLLAWDSWASWGLKARTVYLEGGLTPAVYADPSRRSALQSYPLLLPLMEAWLYGWLGAPDDRLVGAVSVLFYLALAAVAYAAFCRLSLSRRVALGGATAVVAIPHVARLGSGVLADLPLGVFALVAGVSLVGWLDGEPTGTLVLGALAAGLLPWTKQEGLVLLLALCLALALVGRRCPTVPARRVIAGVAVTSAAALILAGPWWMFAIWSEPTNLVFPSVSLETLRTNLSRGPTILRLAVADLVSPEAGLVWPLGILVAIYLGWKGRLREWRPIDVLPVAAVAYLATMVASYLFSGFVPYQQHILSSFHRIASHVVALPLVWMVCRASGDARGSRLDSCVSA